MSFTDNLKKSLGFEEDDFGSAYGISDYGEDEFFEDEFTTISPEQTFYEIVLIRPKSVDDMDYIFDQIVEERRNLKAFKTPIWCRSNFAFTN